MGILLGIAALAVIWWFLLSYIPTVLPFDVDESRTLLIRDFLLGLEKRVASTAEIELKAILDYDTVNSDRVWFAIRGPLFGEQDGKLSIRSKSSVQTSVKCPKLCPRA